jgi:uncharacterized protein
MPERTAMREISHQEILDRLKFDNPWWDGPGIDPFYREMPARAYLYPFEHLVREAGINRAVILMGPRRVGKTVLVHQTIQHLLENGIDGRAIMYVSLETPFYTGLALEKILNLFVALFGHGRNSRLFLFFDEVQYLKDWEIHLKSLVDSYRSYRFVATGSAAAALRLKSRESGAGRFTEFLLPPLTFAEYLAFIGKEDELIQLVDPEGKDLSYGTSDIDSLNDEFLHYLNYGGYPEAIFSPGIQRDSSRFIKSDIIDKVLLRDLPSLYGINDIQELNRLFTTIAYNTGDEVSLDGLAQSSGVAKNTIRKYLEYLEAAFLIRRVHRIDRNARRFERATTFKVYLTNPSMRAALFGPVEKTSEAMGNLTETAIYAQWFHDTGVIDHIHYARWKEGEVDIVFCDRVTQKPDWMVEVKWSDRPFDNPGELTALVDFVLKNGLGGAKGNDPLVTTLSQSGTRIVQGLTVRFLPSSLYCYSVGKNLTRALAAVPLN